MDTRFSAQGNIQRIDKLITVFEDVCGVYGIECPDTDWRYFDDYHRAIFTVPAREVAPLQEAAKRTGVKLTHADDDLWAPGQDLSEKQAPHYQCGPDSEDVEADPYQIW